MHMVALTFALPGDQESTLMEDFRDVMRVMGDALTGSA